MGSILVRKQSSMQMGMPMGGAQITPMMMIGSQSQEAQPQQFPGVNPQGMAGLSQHPVTGAYQATPVMETKQNEKGEMVQTGNELGSHLGDKYGAQSINQMNQRKLKEGQSRAIPTTNPVTGEIEGGYQRGKLNPMRYVSEEKGGGADTGKSAAQVAFERGAKAGELGDRFGRGLARGVGVLSGLVSLANAGATGQDALSGGLGAYQTGQFTSDTMQKPLGEGLGGAAAKVAGKSVGVLPYDKRHLRQTEFNHNLASPTPTHDEQQMTEYYAGPKKIMTTDKHGLPVQFGARASNPGARARSQGGAKQRVNENIGRDTSVNTVAADIDDMGMPQQVERKDGMVAIDGGSPGLDVGATPRPEVAAQQARNVKVAPPTTESTEPTPEDVGNVIGDNTVGVKDTEAGEHIKEQTDAAKKTDTEESMAGKSMTKKKSFNPMQLIGVV